MNLHSHFNLRLLFASPVSRCALTDVHHWLSICHHYHKAAFALLLANVCVLSYTSWGGALPLFRGREFTCDGDPNDTKDSWVISKIILKIYGAALYWITPFIMNAFIYNVFRLFFKGISERPRTQITKRRSNFKQQFYQNKTTPNQYAQKQHDSCSIANEGSGKIHIAKDTNQKLIYLGDIWNEIFDFTCGYQQERFLPLEWGPSFCSQQFNKLLSMHTQHPLIPRTSTVAASPPI